MKYLYSPRFESPAEKAAFPILYSYCIKNKLDFEYQVPIGVTQTHGYSSLHEYLEDTRTDYDGWAENLDIEWDDTSFRISKYRADFIIKDDKKNKKYDVEIDGKDYHGNEFDSIRDEWFKNNDYIVIRIPAKYTLFQQRKMLDILEERIEHKYF